MQYSLWYVIIVLESLWRWIFPLDRHHLWSQSVIVLMPSCLKTKGLLTSLPPSWIRVSRWLAFHGLQINLLKSWMSCYLSIRLIQISQIRSTQKEWQDICWRTPQTTPSAYGLSKSNCRVFQSSSQRNSSRIKYILRSLSL